jgi:hypothetical protein
MRWQFQIAPGQQYGQHRKHFAGRFYTVAELISEGFSFQAA